MITVSRHDSRTLDASDAEGFHALIIDPPYSDLRRALDHLTHEERVRVLARAASEEET